jgi:transposase-like protein
MNNENEEEERFEKLKDTQVERGREEDEATQVAASEVKELRRLEGQSKEDRIRTPSATFVVRHPVCRRVFVPCALGLPFPYDTEHVRDLE